MTKSKTLMYVTLAVVAILAVTAIGFGIRWVIAPMRGATEAREHTVGDGAYRLAHYDEFYDKCSAVQALEDQIATARSDRSLPKDQRATNVMALTNQRASLIRAYNADARKEDTAGAFRADDLPYQLDPNEETRCTEE